MTRQSATPADKALRLRNRIKGKKPKFVKHESWRYKRLKESWRRPTGLDNKMRRKIKGWPPTVSIGYRGPKSARGLHPSGYEEVAVHNVGELEGINPKTQAIRIAHTVGKRKRGRILLEARKRGITVLNLREVKERIEEEKEEALENKTEKEKEREDITEEDKGKQEKTRKRKRSKRRTEK